MSTRAAVALIIFRRPDLAKAVLDVIAEAKPSRLFIFADGPSPVRPGEAEKCAATRAAVEHITWDCEVVRDYSPTNMGPWRRIASGITAAFEQVDELIVLEDDCLPDPTFFRFCDDLLERYRDDERIMHIAGNHFHSKSPREIPYSYSFAWHNIAWGYATWKRAWKHFDLGLPAWRELRDTDFLRQIVGNPIAVDFYRKIFDELHASPGEVDGYDYSWSFACWSQGGLSILPDRTLVRNFGFGADSTHFPTAPTDPRGSLTLEAMPFPLRHPPYVVRDTAADDYIINTYIAWRPPPPSWRRRAYDGITSRIAPLLPAPVRRIAKKALSGVRRAQKAGSS